MATTIKIDRNITICSINERQHVIKERCKTKYSTTELSIMTYDPKRFEYFGNGSYHFVLQELNTKRLIKVPRFNFVFGQKPSIQKISKDAGKITKAFMHDIARDRNVWNTIYPQQNEQATLVNTDYLQCKDELPFSDDDEDRPLQATLNDVYKKLSFLNVPIIEGENYNDALLQLGVFANESEQMLQNAITDELLSIYAETGLIIYDGHSNNFIFQDGDSEQRPIRARCIDIDCAVSFSEEPSVSVFTADITSTALTLKLLNDMIAGQDNHRIASLRLPSVRDDFIQYCNQMHSLIAKEKLSIKQVSFKDHYKKCIKPHFQSRLSLASMFTGMEDGIRIHPIMQIELNILNYIKERGGRKALCGTSFLCQMTWFKMKDKIKNLRAILTYIATMKDTLEDY